jgi:hypothetical protein
MKQRWHLVSLLALTVEGLAALANVFGGELVTLLDSRAGTGGIQMSVALDRTIMEAFASYFIVPAASGSGSDK